jgi:hypothetical protein
MITTIVLVTIIVAGAGIAGLLYLYHPQPQNSSNNSGGPGRPGGTAVGDLQMEVERALHSQHPSLFSKLPLTIPTMS